MGLYAGGGRACGIAPWYKYGEVTSLVGIVLCLYCAMMQEDKLAREVESDACPHIEPLVVDGVVRIETAEDIVQFLRRYARPVVPYSDSHCVIVAFQCD